MNLCNASFGCALNVIFFPYVYGPSVTVIPHCVSSLLHVPTVYSLAISSYVALYVASHVTVSISGVHPANVYVYSAVAALLPLACVGFTPYSTSVVSITVSSSFNHVIVYLFFVALNTALYVASHVTVSISGIHPTNVYVYSAVAALLPLA